MSTKPIESSNPLSLAICSIDILENRLKQIQTMNRIATKKRFVLSRQDIVDTNGKLIVKRAQEIDLPLIKRLRYFLPGNTIIKIFQPDEGIVIVSDFSDKQGISFSMDIVTQVMNIGNGAYSAFIERVNSFYALIPLIKKSLFPKVILVGYIPKQDLQESKEDIMEIYKIDPFLKYIILTQSNNEALGLFPIDASISFKSILVENAKRDSWNDAMQVLVDEYKASYHL